MNVHGRNTRGAWMLGHSHYIKKNWIVKLSIIVLEFHWTILAVLIRCSVAYNDLLRASLASFSIQWNSWGALLLLPTASLLQLSNCHSTCAPHFLLASVSTMDIAPSPFFLHINTSSFIDRVLVFGEGIIATQASHHYTKFNKVSKLSSFFLCKL